MPADTEHEDWFEKLVDVGFEPNKPSFFLWEAVTMYLDRAAVESMLRKISGAAPGSVVAFDYFSTGLLENRSFFMRYARSAANAAGEPLKFGIHSTPPVSGRLPHSSHRAACRWEQRNFGQETDRKHAMAGFATAIV